MDLMKIALAQINPTIGDIEGNAERIISVASGCPPETDLIIFPEMSLCGYPPRDFLEKRWFLNGISLAEEKLKKISAQHPHMGILVGLPLAHNTKTGRGLTNSARLYYQGSIAFTQHKTFLPTYDVFDEARYFDDALEQHVFSFKNEILGISICEDLWNDSTFWPKPLYPFDPIEVLANKGASILINMAASPFEMGKEQLRHNIALNHVRKYQRPFVLVNQVGGNDELIFDGRSFAITPDGHIALRMASFQEDVRVYDTSTQKSLDFSYDSKPAEAYEALVLGVRDYFRKCHIAKAVIGLSGGIDSALVATIACAALGPQHVWGISMPTRYSSNGSVEDSRALAQNLGMAFDVIPIEPTLHTYEKIFTKHFANHPIPVGDTTEENIQARIRGNILMAFSNRTGSMMLNTGNKSEVAMGYCTLYGDMCGGLSVLADVFKTLVYDICAHVNRNTPIIPSAIITKAPSAELRPNQKDEDTLPPYPILDAILAAYLEKHLSAREIIQQGYDAQTVQRVVRTVNHNEHKRRQIPPGLKISSKAFGCGRRFPIAASYKGSQL